MNTIQSINYPREAFLHPLNLAYLMLLSLAAFFVSGTPWMPTLVITLGLGLELLYLGTVPTMPLFRRHVVSRREYGFKESDTEKQQFHQLHPDYQKRFLSLRRLTENVKGNFAHMPGSSRPLTDHLTKRLEKLLAEYIGHLYQRQRYDEYLNFASSDSIRIEIRALEKDLRETSSSRLREVRQRRLAILNRRLEKFQMACEKALVSLSQCETIEDAIRYVYEKSLTMSHPDDIDSQLDMLLAELEETSVIMQDIEDNLPPTYTVLSDMETRQA